MTIGYSIRCMIYNWDFVDILISWIVENVNNYIRFRMQVTCQRECAVCMAKVLHFSNIDILTVKDCSRMQETLFYIAKHKKHMFL